MFTMVRLGWAGRVWLDRYLGRVMSPLAWSLWSQGATLPGEWSVVLLL